MLKVFQTIVARQIGIMIIHYTAIFNFMLKNDLISDRIKLVET